MPYVALLGLHLLVIVVFVGGLLIVALALPGFGREASEDQIPEIRRLRKLSNYAVTPALLLVWVLGISLAIEGNWFTAPWLHGKIALVLILSGLHGYQSGQLRRLAQSVVLARAYSPRWAWGIAAIALVIVALATGKPG
jgi:putative membrane protein